MLLADDVRNTGETFARCAALVREAGGTVVATVEIYDRCEAIVDLGVPNIALAEYKAPENYEAGTAPFSGGGWRDYQVLKPPQSEIPTPNSANARGGVKRRPLAPAYGGAPPPPTVGSPPPPPERKKLGGEGRGGPP